MTTANHQGKDAVELNVSSESAIEFMHEINNQQLGWFLNMDQAKSAGIRMAFNVEQEGTDTGMYIVLRSDGTWSATFTASIKLEG